MMRHAFLLGIACGATAVLLVELLLFLALARPRRRKGDQVKLAPRRGTTALLEPPPPRRR